MKVQEEGCGRKGDFRLRRQNVRMRKRRVRESGLSDRLFVAQFFEDARCHQYHRKILVM